MGGWGVCYHVESWGERNSRVFRGLEKELVMFGHL